jgi:hypothetical protein
MARLRPRVITADDVKVARENGKPERQRGGLEGNAELAASAAPVPDTYINQIVKYIPAEIIALQQFLNGGGAIYAQNTFSEAIFGWLSIGVLLLTPFWFATSTREKGEPVAWSQVVLSTVAFAVWLLAIESPAVGILKTFEVPADVLDKNLWSILFPFFIALTPMLARIFAQARTTSPQTGM